MAVAVDSFSALLGDLISWTKGIFSVAVDLDEARQRVTYVRLQ